MDDFILSDHQWHKRSKDERQKIPGLSVAIDFKTELNTDLVPAVRWYPVH